LFWNVCLFVLRLFVCNLLACLLACLFTYSTAILTLYLLVCLFGFVTFASRLATVCLLACLLLAYVPISVCLSRNTHVCLSVCPLSVCLSAIYLFVWQHSVCLFWLHTQSLWTVWLAFVWDLTHNFRRWFQKLWLCNRLSQRIFLPAFFTTEYISLNRRLSAGLPLRGVELSAFGAVGCRRWYPMLPHRHLNNYPCVFFLFCCVCSMKPCVDLGDTRTGGGLPNGSADSTACC
jgi:hypothetical protein